MQQSLDTKRHEPAAFRSATRLLIGILWLQVSLRVTQAATTQRLPDAQGNQTGVQQFMKIRHAKQTVHLLTARKDGKKIPSIQQDGTYVWWISQARGKFELEDNGTALVVPKEGLYLVNLKMSYNIPRSSICSTSMLWLNTEVQTFHSYYPAWIEILKGEDTMQCVHHWYQSVTLSQVVRLEKGTKLRVIIKAENYAFIVGDKSTYLNVTLL